MNNCILFLSLFLFGCASFSSFTGDRQPNQVIGKPAIASDLKTYIDTNLTFFGRLELPVGSKINLLDVKIHDKLCEVRVTKFTDGTHFIRIKLNIDVAFDGIDLTDTNIGIFFDPKIEDPRRNYKDGEHSIQIDPPEPETRYLIKSDLDFENMKSLEYQIYLEGKIQLRYLCEQDFAGA